MIQHVVFCDLKLCFRVNPCCSRYRYFVSSYVWITFHCTYIMCFFIQHKLLNIWVVSTFWLLWIMLLWTFMYKFFGERTYIFNCLGYGYPWMEFLDHTVTHIFNFWKNCWTFSQSSSTTFHSHQQYMRVLVFPHLLQCLLCICFILTILVEVKHYLIMVSICISLMMNDIEYLLMCLLAVCIASLVKCLFKSFAYFKIGWISFCCWVIRIFMYSGYHTLIEYVTCKYFGSFCGLSFPWQCHLKSKSFWFLCSPKMYLFFFGCLLFKY